ncbi:hypothetical protein VCHA53O466_40372 [Vibrio chagasii]|nr:hypothetical protein VCHA53O466_40372 [Vibrio chagasii]
MTWRDGFFCNSHRGTLVFLYIVRIEIDSAALIVTKVMKQIDGTAPT